jgi:hypothetical protein
MNEVKNHALVKALVKKYERVGNEVYNNNLKELVELTMVAISIGLAHGLHTGAAEIELWNYFRNSIQKLERTIAKNEALLNDPACNLENLSF